MTAQRQICFEKHETDNETNDIFEFENFWMKFC